MASDTASPRPMRTRNGRTRRKARYRRRLRSRIILSFVIFGFGLTALIASTAVYLRNRVEDEVLSAALLKNNNLFAEGFYRNPDAIGVPFEKIQGLQVNSSRLDRVPEKWRGLPNGVYELTDRDDATGEE